MNVKTRLEFELPYYDSEEQRFNHHTMRTLHQSEQSYSTLFIRYNTVKEFRVLRCNIHKFCTQLKGSNYAYVKLTIQLNSHLLTHKLSNSSIWPIDRTLSGTAIRVDLGVMGVKWYSTSTVSSRIGALPSDGFESYQDTSWKWSVIIFRVAVGVFDSFSRRRR